MSSLSHIFDSSVYGVDDVQHPTGERGEGTFSLTGAGFISPTAFAAPTR